MAAVDLKPINTLTQATSVNKTDKTIIFDGTNTKLAEVNDLIYQGAQDGPGAHSLYRGKAKTLDADFWASIADGTFKDQFVGDTVTLNGRTYHLAHPDYWINTGDSNCTTHHWVVVSPVLGTSKINDAGGVVGGYAGSDFRTGNNSITGLADALALIKADFGAAHILSHRELLDNAVTGGYPSSGNWFDSEAELMSQVQVYGNKCLEPSTNLGQTIPYVYTVDKTQFALFAQRPDLISTRSDWWLRDVVSAAYFALVYSNGDASRAGTSYAHGIRLAFGIKA